MTQSLRHLRMFSYFAGPNSAVQALSQHGLLKAIENNMS